MHSEEHLVTLIQDSISAIGQQPICFFLLAYNFARYYDFGQKVEIDRRNILSKIFARPGWVQSSFKQPHTGLHLLPARSH